MSLATLGTGAPESDTGFGAGQRRVLEMIATGAPLDATLAALVAVAEAESPRMRGSFLRHDPERGRLFLLAAPHIPGSYMDAIADGLPVAEGSGSCGTAAARRAPFTVDDIAAHPYWADARELALGHGLRACWSTPVLGSDGAVLGTFAMYYDTPRAPGPEMARIAGPTTHLAAIAMERDRAARAERAAREAAEHASEVRGRFIAMMSHELRTPLNAIVGYGALLEDGIAGPVSEAQRDYLARIRLCATLLGALVNNVLTLSVLESGRDPLSLAEVDLAALAREGLDVILPLAEARGLAVVLEAPDAPVRVRTDAAKLRQIVLNLLSNAVKFSPAGQVVVRVTRDGARARVQVEDSGIGIAAEDLERIWLPFTQAEGGTTRRFDGAGLGLAICRELASRLGGTLTVASTPGRGSTFTCTLPADGPAAEGR